jgi:hypothetical protein
MVPIIHLIFNLIAVALLMAEVGCKREEVAQAAPLASTPQAQAGNHAGTTGDAPNVSADTRQGGPRPAVPAAAVVAARALRFDAANERAATSAPATSPATPPPVADDLERIDAGIQRAADRLQQLLLKEAAALDGVNRRARAATQPTGPATRPSL